MNRVLSNWAIPHVFQRRIQRTSGTIVVIVCNGRIGKWLVVGREEGERLKLVHFIAFKWSGGPRYSLTLAIWTPSLCVYSRDSLRTCAVWPWHFLWHGRTDIPDVPSTSRLTDVKLCGNSCKFFCASTLRSARFSAKNLWARNQSVDWWIIGFAFDSCERDKRDYTWNQL